ncbi:hypothetical protein H920_12597 [Fukomys damarensis]|uniref:Uncharacterized protein n=1 Tax=Fukomys damarensis TaxID=885580 RepID=A0A091DTB3_FUKDA|nr:hypothetical protein H920_12597 [Fukomys damarensis]
MDRVSLGVMASSKLPVQMDAQQFTGEAASKRGVQSLSPIAAVPESRRKRPESALQREGSGSDPIPGFLALVSCDSRDKTSAQRLGENSTDSVSGKESQTRDVNEDVQRNEQIKKSGSKQPEDVYYAVVGKAIPQLSVRPDWLTVLWQGKKNPTVLADAKTSALSEDLPLLHLAVQPLGRYDMERTSWKREGCRGHTMHDNSGPKSPGTVHASAMTKYLLRPLDGQTVQIPSQPP